jgi:hypothetical protein
MVVDAGRGRGNREGGGEEGGNILSEGKGREIKGEADRERI